MRVGVAALLAVVWSGSAIVRAQETVPFDSDRWVLDDAEVTEHLGRTAVAGTALLPDVELGDGVIEFDLAIDGRRSYPGVRFRVQSASDYENFYIRPHRSPWYTDALQYTPVFRGTAGWQLYSGDGFTAGAELPHDRWFTVRLELLGARARVYLDGAERPALVIHELKHGTRPGSLGLSGPRDGSAYFSNFRFRRGGEPSFPPAVPDDPVPGVIAEWQLSQAMEAGRIDPRRGLPAEGVPAIEWRTVQAEPSGLVDVSRHLARLGRQPDAVLARATVRATAPGLREFRFGYSDRIRLFFNGTQVFSGASDYRLRDPSFLGVVGLNDAVHLPLREGENELLLVITESFGGWGFVVQDATAVFVHPSLQRAWTVEGDLRTPETVVYDADRDAFYVSNYDAYNPSGGAGLQSIARLTADGRLAEARWVEGLDNPTGMVVHAGRLFVVERRGVAEIDPGTRQIVARHPIAGARFLNDVAVDGAGRLYVSDSGADTIYRSENGGFETWIRGGEIARPNGLHVVDGGLLVANNGDGTLKRVDLASATVASVVQFRPGILDGIETDAEGNYLVSQAEGRLYRVTPSGVTTRLLDTSVPETEIANFTFVPDRRLLVIPTLTGDRIVAYRVAQ